VSNRVFVRDETATLSILRVDPWFARGKQSLSNSAVFYQPGPEFLLWPAGHRRRSNRSSPGTFDFYDTAAPLPPRRVPFIVTTPVPPRILSALAQTNRQMLLTFSGFGTSSIVHGSSNLVQWQALGAASRAFINSAIPTRRPSLAVSIASALHRRSVSSCSAEKRNRAGW